MKKESQLVPQLRFPEFEEEWEENNFSKFIKLYRGSSPRPINLYLTKSENGVNWIKIGDTKNTKNFVLTQVSEKITRKGSLKSRHVRKGELILANSMSFGKTYLLEIDGCIYDGWFVLREYEKHFNKPFLVQLLNSDFLQRQYKRLSAGGVVQNISSSIVYSTVLRKPILSEQLKIASFLTTVDQRIQCLEKKKSLLEQYKKGLMQRLFAPPLSEIEMKGLEDDTNSLEKNENPTILKSNKSKFRQLRFKDDVGREYPEWEEKRLGEVVTLVSAKYDPFKETDFVRCIELEHLASGSSRLLGYIDGSTSKSIKNKFERSDILFGKLRPYLKKHLQASFNGVCSSEIWVMKGVELLNDFLYRLVQTNKFLKLANQSSGSKMPRANWKVVEKGIFSIPSLPEQTKIANFLTAIDRKIELVNGKIEKTREFKKGLLQQMFV